MRRQKETYKLITANTAKINNASSISIIISKLKKIKGNRHYLIMIEQFP